MATQQDRAIVLRLSDYSETSQIATLFTDQAGLIRVIAKGMRRGTSKRVAVGLDLLELGDVVFAPPRRGIGLGTLTEWMQRDGFMDLRGALATLHAGLYAAELVTFMTEEYDPHPNVFESLRSLLRQLADIGSRPGGSDRSSATVAEPSSELTASGPRGAAHDRVDTALPLYSTVTLAAHAVLVFQCAVALAIGFAPTIQQCIACGRARPAGAAAFFSPAAGGVICRDCEARFREKQRVRGAILDHVHDTQNADVRPAAISATNAKTESDALVLAVQLLDYHLRYSAGRNLEMSDRLLRSLKIR